MKLRGVCLGDQLRLFKQAGAPNLVNCALPTTADKKREALLDVVDLYLGSNSGPITVAVTKISVLKPQKKKKYRNWIQDCISKTAFPRSWELGPHLRDHRNQDCIFNIMVAGSHFQDYRNEIKMLRSRN